MFRYSGPTWCEEKLGFLNGKVSEGIHLICRWVSGPYTGTVKGPVLRMGWGAVGAIWCGLGYLDTLRAF